MRIVLLLCALAATPVLANQPIWKWVDEQGVTHYSDRPVPGATQVNVTTAPRSTDDDRAPSYSSSSSSSTATTPTQPAATAYSRFEITRPQADDTIANTGGEVLVSVRLEPSLNPGHGLALYMDGKLVPEVSATALDYSLKEVARGTHSLVAIVQDGRGRRIQETQPISFTVRQESIASPPVGPSLKPPPKPQPRRGAANKLPTRQPSYAALNGGVPEIDPATNLPVKPPPKPAGPRQGN